jgi:arylsulfatase A-like enzyme
MTYSRRSFLGTAGGALAGGLSSAAPRRPNIIWIMADDLGYGDLSCLNEKSKIQTPNLDRMAGEGVVFTDAHSPSAVCSPTRYGVMTGRYCWRSPLKHGVLGGGSAPLIAQDRLTVARLLKQQGYATAAVGKWHLGLDWPTRDGKPVAADMSNVDFTKPYGRGPNTLGFDYYYGISASLDMPPYTYLENDRATELPDGMSEGKPFPVNWRRGPIAPGFKHQEVMGRLTEKATGWIDRQGKSGKPFFLYFPLSAPHTPVVPAGRFKGRTGVGDYGAFVAEVDETAGQVIEAVRRAGAERNTLIIFTSDNGPERQMVERKAEYQHYSAYHFRGHKRHIWDGGHRIPYIARWPGRIQPGTRTGELICLTDLMATCAAITGAKLPYNSAEDSYNILPALLGGKRSRPIREAVVHHSASGAFAIRQGEWKLLELRGTGDGAPSKDTSLPPGQLYNIATDPGEENNVYDRHPDIVKRLSALLDRYRSEGRSTPGPRVEPTPEERAGARGAAARGGVEQ